MVFTDGKKDFVWVIEAGKAVQHSVQTGRSTSSRVEIAGGLVLGAKVIDPGDLLISEGTKVRAKIK
jgi:hypothetical protein